ncbi:LysM domain-containing protein [Granulicella sp. WH15]|nr:LysM domain-containing protein [Granulicella sp. WH15]
MNTSLFPTGSRYAGIDTGTLTTNTGRSIAYVQRRFLPKASTLAVLQQYTVAQGDRLDNIAYSTLGDPGLFWQLCDANTAMRPSELEVQGRTLNVTLPQGTPGARNA